jgi:hypothetical protein
MSNKRTARTQEQIGKLGGSFYYDRHGKQRKKINND